MAPPCPAIPPAVREAPAQPTEAGARASPLRAARAARARSGGRPRRLERERLVGATASASSGPSPSGIAIAEPAAGSANAALPASSAAARRATRGRPVVCRHRHQRAAVDAVDAPDVGADQAHRRVEQRGDAAVGVHETARLGHRQRRVGQVAVERRPSRSRSSSSARSARSRSPPWTSTSATAFGPSWPRISIERMSTPHAAMQRANTARPPGRSGVVTRSSVQSSLECAARSTRRLYPAGVGRRIFVGLPVRADAAHELAAFARHRLGGLPVRAIEPAMLHATLVFCGPTDEEPDRRDRRHRRGGDAVRPGVGPRAERPPAARLGRRDHVRGAAVAGRRAAGGRTPAGSRGAGRRGAPPLAPARHRRPRPPRRAVPGMRPPHRRQSCCAATPSWCTSRCCGPRERRTSPSTRARAGTIYSSASSAVTSRRSPR